VSVVVPLTLRSRFLVIGFPCNQFGGQEPGTPEEIKAFVSEKYGVTFPVSFVACRLRVVGSDQPMAHAGSSRSIARSVRSRSPVTCR
jgi:hypothetical protein